MKPIFNLLSAVLLAAFGFTAEASILSPQTIRQSGTFNTESHPLDNNIIRATGNTLGFIQNGTWVAYNNFDFGTVAGHLSIEVASATAGGTLQVRTGSATGPVIGSATIANTGSFTNFVIKEIPLTSSVSGVQNLYFTFSGGGGFLFDTRTFWFSASSPNLKLASSAINAVLFDQESHPSAAPVVVNAGAVEQITGGSWVAFTGFDFGTNANAIEIESSAAARGGRIEVRVDSPTGTLVGGIDAPHTGSWTFSRVFSAKLTQPVSGTKDLYLCFVDSNASGAGVNLFNLKRFSIFHLPPPASLAEGSLAIYDLVPGFAQNQSPYYNFKVQKVSALNAVNKQNATNWLEPFAWFTKCVDKDSVGEGSAYYKNFIGSWSHTYCNFELDRQTPIVVKVTRLNKPGAPSGPITSAAAHPAHKVISCEIINGEVYVTMSEPSQITIDIDGQMDGRNAPRAYPGGDYGINAFPYATEAAGSHAVTIFANPFITDKPPATGGSGVRYVEPGTLPDYSGNWTTMYFKPGIHKLSVDAQGNEREWVPSDSVPLRNGKSYYIPGDAIIYGNMHDSGNPQNSADIRIFGHGTLSGTKIPHWQNFTDPSYALAFPDKPNLTWRLLPGGAEGPLRMVSLYNPSNCRIEGITCADQPEHGLYMLGGGQRDNFVRWVKMISWRVNNDSAVLYTAGAIEDSFFRHQDDATYLTDAPVRRCVFWSDVNGQALRCDRLVAWRGAGTPAWKQTDQIVEDCDIIYARAVFGDDSVLGTNNVMPTSIYGDGTPNTAQHFVFRNIRMTDPRPQRTLLNFNGSEADLTFRGWAGIRFENVEARFPNAFGFKNKILGTTNGPARYWTFSDVSIGGVPMDLAMLNDTARFNTLNVSDMIFKGPTYTTHTLNTLASADGSIARNPLGTVYRPGSKVTLTAAPNPGFTFSSWSGALAGVTTNPAIVTIDGNKSVSANYIASPTSFSVNSGGSAFTAADATAFTADSNFSGGSPFSTASSISGTTDDTLYQSERWGASFSYNIPLSVGGYEVTLLFAEINLNAAGQRVFNVALEGTQVITGLDIFSKVGKNAAYSEKRIVNVVDGNLNIGFTSTVNNAKISGIKVRYVGPVHSYAVWAATNGITGSPLDNTNSGILTNLQKFAFGTNPTSSSGGSFTYVAGGSVTNPGLPVAVNLAAGAGLDFHAVFGRRKNFQSAGLTYTVQFSVDLDTWVNSPDTPTILTGAGSTGEIEAVSVPYPPLIPVTNGFKKPTFFRVGVTSSN